MFVDASALTAILIGEPDGGEIEARMYRSLTPLLTSPLAIFETVLAVSPKRNISFAEGEALVLDYISLAVEVVSINAEIGRLAIEARARYGKGTGHKAKLNMGDCFAYACAKAHGVPLLYKGDDFVHTDLA